jgi:hypothetical protein
VKVLLKSDPRWPTPSPKMGSDPLGLACFFDQEPVARLAARLGADQASSNGMRVMPPLRGAARTPCRSRDCY